MTKNAGRTILWIRYLLIKTRYDVNEGWENCYEHEQDIQVF